MPKPSTDDYDYDAENQMLMPKTPSPPRSSLERFFTGGDRDHGDDWIIEGEVAYTPTTTTGGPRQRGRDAYTAKGEQKGYYGKGNNYEMAMARAKVKTNICNKYFPSCQFLASLPAHCRVEDHSGGAGNSRVSTATHTAAFV